MAHDLEERLRRSLADRAEDVRPHPATWQRVEAGVRRQAAVRWSLAGATALAALVLATLALTGLRIDLAPADPPSPDGVSLSDPLIFTDGTMIYRSGPAGTYPEPFDEAMFHEAWRDQVHHLESTPEGSDLPPITYVSVRPGSTLDELAMAFTRAEGCERVEVGWMTLTGGSGISNEIRRAEGLCVTDPVWSPDGAAVAWVERHPPDGDFVLHLRDWADGYPGEDVSGWALDVGDAEQEVASLRATDWWFEPAEDGSAHGVISFAARRTDGTAKAYALQVSHETDGRMRPEPLLEPAGLAPEEVRSVLRAAAHPESPPGGSWGYELGIEPDGTVLLSRLADDADPQRMPLPADVLTGEDLDSGEAWMAARGATVLFGVGGDAWTVRHTDGGWGELQAVAGIILHAAFLEVGPSEPPPPAEASGDELPEAVEQARARLAAALRGATSRRSRTSWTRISAGLSSRAVRRSSPVPTRPSSAWRDGGTGVPGIRSPSSPASSTCRTATTAACTAGRWPPAARSRTLPRRTGSC